MGCLRPLPACPNGTKLGLKSRPSCDYKRLLPNAFCHGEPAMFVDPMRARAFQQLRQHDLRPLTRLLTIGLLVQAARDSGVRLSTSPLNVLTLVWLALAAALRPNDNFTTLLGGTLKMLQDLEGFARTPLGRLSQTA